MFSKYYNYLTNLYHFLKIYLFIWLHWVFIGACGIFSCGMREL